MTCGQGCLWPGIEETPSLTGARGGVFSRVAGFWQWMSPCFTTDVVVFGAALDIWGQGRVGGGLVFSTGQSTELSLLACQTFFFFFNQSYSTSQILKMHFRTGEMASKDWSTYFPCWNPRFDSRCYMFPTPLSPRPTPTESNPVSTSRYGPYTETNRATTKTFLVFLIMQFYFSRISSSSKNHAW